jgi:transposase
MAKPIAMSILKQIIRQWCNGVPLKAIARHTHVSRNTVKHYLNKIKEKELCCQALLSLDDHQLSALFTSVQVQSSEDRYKDLIAEIPAMMGELNRTGVNRWVLWNEYKTRHPDGYQYSQFCHHISCWEKSGQATLRREQQPADRLYIDFCGKHLEWVDRSTGEVHKAEVFVAVLGYSQMTYVEACANQRQGCFIEALDNGLHYLGGVPKAIVPDNMKTAVIKADKYEPSINHTLSQLANHYQTTILPARSRKPRDKSIVEQAVRTVYSRIFAPLRNQIFYSIDELNQAIAVQLKHYNEYLFQGKDYSRSERFTEEKPLLTPLPSDRFMLSKSCRMQVMKNSHIRLSEDKHYYSVPYRYIGSRVKVEYSEKQVTIYSNHQRIATHPRNYRHYGYSTVKEHLPSAHQFVSEWSAEKFIHWASGIDPVVGQYIRRLMEAKRYPEQAYRSCIGILSFVKRVGKHRLIAACQRADHFGAYNYKTIEGILKNRLDEQPLPGRQLTMRLPDHDNIRGAENYQ